MLKGVWTLFITIKHGVYRGIELVGESLLIHSMSGQSQVLQENVKDVAITVYNQTIRIVAFLDQEYAWFFAGDGELGRTRIEFGQPYGGGGKLLNDNLGNTHLFYYLKQSPGPGHLLRHQVFQKEWSTPALVSMNVFGERQGYSVAWHHDNYIHIAYCSSKGQQLLYRAYNLEHRMWSGAVPFSEQRCSYPQFISGDKLYLFWQEDGEKTNLNVRQKEQNWSAVTRISTGENHASNVGYGYSQGQWQIFWGEGEHFYQAVFDNWGKRENVDRSTLNYTWIVHDQGTLPIYEQKEVVSIKPAKAEEYVEERTSVVTAPKEELKAPPQVSEQETIRKKRESEENKVQAAFMEQAFRTLQEWERVREEIQRWKGEFRQPEPVDLTPLSTRLERLERRFLTLQQSQEQNKKLLETSLTQLEQEFRKMKTRLQSLEQQDKDRQRSLWQRVLRKLPARG